MDSNSFWRSREVKQRKRGSVEGKEEKEERDGGELELDRTHLNCRRDGLLGEGGELWTRHVVNGYTGVCVCVCARQVGVEGENVSLS